MVGSGAPEMAGYDLVILDFYDTVVRMEGEEWTPRNGMRSLLESLVQAGKTVAVCSDAGEDEIRQRLGGLSGYFVGGVYGGKNCVHEGGLHYKNLERVCEDLAVRKDRAIFIGDNHMGTDERSAERYGIKYVKVPNGEEARDYDFSGLADILLG